MSEGPLAVMRSIGRIEIGALEIDADRYQASFRGRLLELSRSELELLSFLVANRYRVLSRDELSQALGLAHARSVDVVLSRLRRLIGREFVRNVRGRGWILMPDVLEG